MPLQLDRLESLSKEDLDLYKEQLGTNDENEVKAHILRIASKAHEIFNYRCIEYFSFARLKTGIYDKIGPSSAYHRALNVCLQHEDAIFLELGTFFGTTLRKAVMEGIPVNRVIGSDIHSQFWDLGHELFGTTPKTFPAAFVVGDAFDPAFISGRGPCTEYCSTGVDIPDLQSLTSLIPLQGRVSVIHISAVFHLFNEEQQVQLAKAISSLLYPRSGSMIFGVQMGQEVAGVRETYRPPPRFLHDPESWKKLWDGGVFPTGSVKVEAKLRPVESDKKDDISLLIWSCTLL